MAAFAAPAEAPAAPPNASAPETSPAPETTWEELERVAVLPEAPVEWQTNRPSPQAYAEYRTGLANQIAAAADRVRDFLARHPQHPHAAEAKRRAEALWTAAAQMGHSGAAARLDELEAERLRDPTLSAETRFRLRARATLRQTTLPPGATDTNGWAKAEQTIQALRREFPDRLEPWEMLLDLAERAPAALAREWTLDIARGSAPEPIRRQAQLRLKSLEWLGKRLDLKFVARDGRAVDLQQWRGRVVLLAFGAVWCGPYVAGLPEDLDRYTRFHPEGLEVAAISFDRDAATLDRFVETQGIPWPVYFDGQGWRNRFALEWGIRRLPTYWLIDKAGVLRDLNARPEEEARLTQLLAEPQP